jgi:hypothetical protein
MPIATDSLSSFAIEYTKRMSSLRGRRVQRLIKREFGGAEFVLLAKSSAGEEAILGLSSSGAAICITDGKGKQACVIKWAHQATVAYETRFDLHKDSLPVLGSDQLPIVLLREQTHIHVPAESVPPEAAALVAKVLEALA